MAKALVLKPDQKPELQELETIDGYITSRFNDDIRIVWSELANDAESTAFCFKGVAYGGTCYIVRIVNWILYDLTDDDLKEIYSQILY